MTRAKAVTPSDTVSLDASSIIYVGGAGNVACVTEYGDAITFVGLNAGDTIPVWIKQVKSTNTTATNLVACW